MDRNLVLFHLESLNCLNYYMNQDFFPTLKEIEKKSVSFSRFYASATSTFMIMGDLAYGEDHVLESLKTMDWRVENKSKPKSLFDKLKDKGYYVRIIDYPPNGADAHSMSLNGFVGNRVTLEEFSEKEQYISTINECIGHEEPFALWVCNFLSHIDFGVYEMEELDGLNRWGEGYRRVDKAVSQLFTALEDKGLLGSTSVVFYGDHGDDFYSHGYRGGLTHAIEPYEQLIHTPMFVYDERLRPQIRHDLIGTCDIADIIGFLLKTDAVNNSLLDTTNHSYVFSRNMFAAQRVRTKTFDKGYSVTDGSFLLVVCSKGMSMYYTVMDPTCQNNLLSLFCVNDGTIQPREEINEYRFHFKYLMDEKSLQLIEDKYNELFPVLYKKTLEYYKSGGCDERIYEMNFSGIADTCNDAEYLRRDNKNESYFDVFYPYVDNKNVILYGAGNYGKYCYYHIKDRCRIIAWVDERCEELMDQRVSPPQIICTSEYDVIYIAISNGRDMQDVYNQLIEWGVDRKKIV